MPPRSKSKKVASFDTKQGKLKQLRKDAREEKEEATTEEPLLVPLKSQRVLLPRPEGNAERPLHPPTQVIASSSTGNTAKKASGSHPNTSPVKKVYLLGPNGVLYEAVLATAVPTPSQTSSNQNVGLTTSPALPIQISTHGQTSAEEGIKSSVTSNSVVESGSDIPVEEIQVKVEISDILGDEEMPPEDNNEIITGDLLPVFDEETNSLSVKKTLSNDEDESKTSSNPIVKKEEILENTTLGSLERSNNSLEGTVHEQQSVQKLDPTCPWKAPLQPNQTNFDSSLYCDECSRDYEGDCPEHGPLEIVDDIPVPADINDRLRAKKTGPSVISIADSVIPGVGSRVWAREVIPARTRFGPLDGEIVSSEVCTLHTWLINGKPDYCIDVGEPGLSNWMRYVSTARRVGEDNLRPFQYLGKLYFRTTRQINPSEELLLDDEVDDDMEIFETNTERTEDDGKDDLSSDDEVIELHSDSSNEPISTTVDDQQSSNTITSNSTEGGGFACSLCEARFKFKGSLTNHVKTHEFVCNICSERFFHESSLSKHLEQHEKMLSQKSSNDSNCKTGSRYYCKVCNTPFVYEDSLKLHMLTHSTRNELQCVLCKESFLDERTLKLHMEVHEDTTYSCPVCDKSFRFQSSLNKHLGKHGENPFACPFCKERFASAEALKSHQKIHAGSKRFNCNICHKDFANASIFNKHLATHQKDIVCVVCDKRFASVRRLNGHLRAHKGVEAFECMQCDFKFSRHIDLKKHERTHYKYACSRCGRHFAEREDMEEHLRTHANSRRYKCDICGATFSRKEYLSKHVMSHVNKNPYECHVCKKRFKAVRFLRSHLRAQHLDRTCLQTWKSWEEWKNQGSQNRSAVD